MTLFTAENVTVRLGNTAALDGVALSVDRGEFVGLIGPNGAGKTTFLRVAAGLLTPDTGTIRIDGRGAGDLGPAGLARTLAYLPYGAPAHWPMPARAIVALGRLPHLPPWRRLAPADEAVVDAALARAQASDLADRRIDILSAGERARVMIARALAQEPKLLLADEPTAALDPYHQLRVIEILRGIADSGGAVLAVFHDLPLAARFCTRLTLLVSGKVVAQGRAEDVLSADNVRAAYGVEVAMTRATTFSLPEKIARPRFDD